jgi:Protein of unknown function (DUF3307).
MSPAAVFAAVFAALYAAHSFGDHWVQTHRQALAKGGTGWTGRRACLWHVVTLTVTKVAALGALVLVTGLELRPASVALALTADAVSHYWADRRVPLGRLAGWIGKAEFYRLGEPRVAPCGTGAYALDQAWHHLFLFIAALVVAGGAA